MAQRDRDWPGYTQWFFCPACESLWTRCESGIAAIKRPQLLAPPMASLATPAEQCPVCAGSLDGSTHEL